MLVSYLTRNTHIEVKFITDSCIIQDPHSLKIIDKAKRVVDLYIMSLDSSIPVQNNCNYSFKNDCNSVSSAVNNVSAHTWHHRLGQ